MIEFKRRKFITTDKLATNKKLIVHRENINIFLFSLEIKILAHSKADLFLPSRSIL